jgi:hypothetical protein
MTRHHCTIIGNICSCSFKSLLPFLSLKSWWSGLSELYGKDWLSSSEIPGVFLPNHFLEYSGAWHFAVSGWSDRAALRYCPVMGSLCCLLDGVHRYHRLHTTQLSPQICSLCTQRELHIWRIPGWALQFTSSNITLGNTFYFNQLKTSLYLDF